MGKTLSLSLSVVAILGHGVLPSAVAQVSGNSLDGIVHDHSRTVVVAVALILVETSTKTEYKEKKGRGLFLQLCRSQYGKIHLTSSVPSFRTLVRTRIVLA
jgi:hypothetical protein